MIDHSAFPHILDAVIGFASHAALLRLRATSRSVKRKADGQIVYHIIVTDEDVTSAVDDWPVGYEWPPKISKGKRIPRLGCWWEDTALVEAVRVADVHVLAEIEDRLRLIQSLVNLQVVRQPANGFSKYALAAPPTRILIAQDGTGRALSECMWSAGGEWINPNPIPTPAVFPFLHRRRRCEVMTMHVTYSGSLRRCAELFPRYRRPEWELDNTLEPATDMAIVFLPLPQSSRDDGCENPLILYGAWHRLPFMVTVAHAVAAKLAWQDGTTVTVVNPACWVRSWFERPRRGSFCLRDCTGRQRDTGWQRPDTFLPDDDFEEDPTDDRPLSTRFIDMVGVMLNALPHIERTCLEEGALPSPSVVAHSSDAQLSRLKVLSLDEYRAEVGRVMFELVTM